MSHSFEIEKLREASPRFPFWKFCCRWGDRLDTTTLIFYYFHILKQLHLSTSEMNMQVLNSPTFEDMLFKLTKLSHIHSFSFYLKI